MISHRSAFRQRGISLIEILIALFVLAIGVLGYAGMQLFSLRGAEDAGYRATAMLIAVDTMERIMLNSEEEVGYFSASAWPTTAPTPGGSYPDDCMSSACTAAQLVDADIDQLAWAAANSLPNGMVRAQNDCTGGASPDCVVVSWGEVTPDDCLSGAAINTAATCVVLEARRL